MALKSKIFLYSIFLILIIITILLIQGTFIESSDNVKYINSNGINEDIKIYRNEYGIPNIESSNLEDYYFALGYMNAKDRLLQLELQRKLAKGELSNFLNSDFVVVDKFIRDLGLEKKAIINSKNLDSNSIRFVKKYIKGINRYLSLNKNKLPYEFGVTNHYISDYQISDILLLEELYKLQKNNVIKEKLFIIMSIINIGKTKTLKLLKELNLKVKQENINLIASKEYTYGKLKYLYKIFKIIDKISLSNSSFVEPIYIINNDSTRLFSYSNISKSFLNFGDYSIQANVDSVELIAIYDVGRITPKIIRKSNNQIFCELRNDYDYYDINLFDIAEKKYLYKDYLDTNFTKFKIEIDTFSFKNKQKYIYSYSIDSLNDLICYDDDLSNFGINLKSNLIENNWINYYFNNFELDKKVEYFGDDKSFISFKNDSLFEYDLSINIEDSINIYSYKRNNIKDIKSYYPSDYISYPKNQNMIFKRLQNLLSDDHNFNLTDVKLINNDNKNILASKHLWKLIKILKKHKFNKNKKNQIEKLKNWDYLDNYNTPTSQLFEFIINNFLIEYFKINYNEQVYELLEYLPEFKLTISDRLLNKITNDLEIEKIFINSFKNNKLNLEHKSKSIPHIITYFNNKEIISLNLQNIRAGFSGIRYCYEYNNSFILNNSSLFFDINNKSNSIMMNFGSSSDLESQWNTNLFELWLTGGTIESNFDNVNKKLIIKFSND